MNDYIRKIKKTIEENQLMTSGDQIVIGLSGGVDSVALLGLLVELKDVCGLNIYPLYVHHNIRKEADKDVMFCKNLCVKLGLTCKVIYVDVPKEVEQTKKSEEEVARKLRYKALRDYKMELGANRIAIAHHKEDQAETIIHRFLRGAGGLGLRGMTYKREDIIRPLLDFTKEELVSFVKSKGLGHVVDESNLDTKYTRNRIRHQLIPFLKAEFNPNLTNNLIRLSQILTEDESYMDNEAKKVFDYVSCDRNEINIDLLSEYPKAILRRVIRLSILKFKGDLKNIEYSHIERIISLLDQQSGKRVTLCEDIVVLKEFNRLKYLRENSIGNSKLGFAINLDTVPIKGYIQEVNMAFSLRQIEQVKYKELINYKDSFKISQNVYTKWFDYDKIKANLVLRSRKSGDFIRIHKDGGTKSIKKVFVDKKVPGSLRNRIPLLADGKEIIWAIGLRDNPTYAVTQESKIIIEVELTKEDKHGN